MICFHHNDLDGRCAAAIVLREFPSCTMWEIDYKDNPNFDCLVKRNELVYIVDFSFKPEKMAELLDITKTIYWIDHHETAEKYNYGLRLMGLRDFSKECKRSGAELTWGHFNQDADYQINWAELPEAVRLVGDYDCWRFDTPDITNLFQQGMKLEDTGPSALLWTFLLEGGVGAAERIPDIIGKGAVAKRFRDNFCANYRKSYGWEVEFEGHKCYAMNLYTVGSQGFGPEFDNYDVVLSFVYQDCKWTVSLYSKEVHVGEIAQKYGGGGHKGAAGFVCKKLPF